MKNNIRRFFDARIYVRGYYLTNYNFRILNGGLGYQPGDAARGGTKRFPMRIAPRPAPLGPNEKEPPALTGG